MGNWQWANNDGIACVVCVYVWRKGSEWSGWKEVQEVQGTPPIQDEVEREMWHMWCIVLWMHMETRVGVGKVTGVPEVDSTNRGLCQRLRGATCNSATSSDPEKRKVLGDAYSGIMARIDKQLAGHKSLAHRGPYLLWESVALFESQSRLRFCPLIHCNSPLSSALCVFPEQVRLNAQSSRCGNV